jgi:putative copper export protein/mono/diheme cytochrome c family protein/peroxiredoxin
VSALALALRWIHLAASVALVGGAVMLLLAGRSDRPTACAWQTRVTRVAGWLLLVAVLAGVGVLAHQTALLEGRASAAFEPRALLRVATQTQSGLVWVARLGVLLVAGVFVAGRFRVVSRVDWLALHGETAALALIALGLLSAAGHAAAVEPGALRAIAVDFVHLAAAGLWAGALPALALLLRAAAREAGADARPYAVLATRRFSRWALTTVVVLTVSGLANALTHIRDVAGVIGTPYGRLLVVKVIAFALALAFAALNRWRFIPVLGGEAATVGRPAMRRLAAAVTMEALLVTGVLGVVAALGITPPARHEQPAWPFSFRLATSALETTPDAQWQVLVGSQVLVLGVVVIVCALMVRRLRLPLVAGALVLVVTGGTMALIPLAVDAYPTTYHRPTVPYTVSSIASGADVYAERCAACHGRSGGGDGPAAPRLPRPPADLRAPHTGQHTAGDLFWWISHGIPRGAMPGFASALTEEQRWDVINYVRLLGALEAARWLSPTVDPGRAWLVAPDFSYAVAPAPPRSLRDYRGGRHVLLVLYTLPASRPRLAQLAEAYQLLSTVGVEVIAVPTDAAPDAIRRLGADSRILFPIVTEGAADILTVYRRFDAAPHVELLIDRQGYIRARWSSRAETTRDVNRLLAEVQELNEEKVEAPPADEHVH